MDNPLPIHRDHDSIDHLQASDHDHGHYHTMTLDPLDSMPTTSTSTEPLIDANTHVRKRRPRPSCDGDVTSSNARGSRLPRRSLVGGRLRPLNYT